MNRQFLHGSRSSTLRVGIMGCASIARRSLVPAFINHPDFELVAVASRSVERALSFISDVASPDMHIRACSYAAMTTDTNIDLVYCPLPTGLHYEWVRKCLENGKHVLCEKSLACSFEEVEELVDIARKNRCFLMESFQFRFHAQNLYVKELLSKAVIGKIRQAVIRFGIPPFPDGEKNIRYSRDLGGGALLDNGAYTVKCATYFFGDRVNVLSAMCGGAEPSLGGVDLTGSAMMVAPELSHPTQIFPIHTAYGFDHFYQNAYEIWGTNGKITTERAFTARADFAAPVILELKSGRQVKTFNDDHFARLLDYVHTTIESGIFEAEYQECLVQSRLLSEVMTKGDLK